MTLKKYNKAVIWGVGLMGGSLGLALKKKSLAKQVWGLGRHAGRLETAKKKLKLSGVGTQASQVCVGADLIILAGPFEEYERQLAYLAGQGLHPALVSEVASLKGNYVKRWTRAAGKLNFVASHPMCGSEKSGFENSRLNLFSGASCVVTPLAQTKPGVLFKAKALWRSLGMTVRTMSPQEHDKKIGTLSHVTHAVAFALALTVDSQITAEDYRLAGTGYWDSTRVAASDSALWTQILRGNSQHVDKSLEQLQKNINKLRQAIQGRSALPLKKSLKRISDIRKREEKKRSCL